MQMKWNILWHKAQWLNAGAHCCRMLTVRTRFKGWQICVSETCVSFLNTKIPFLCFLGHRCHWLPMELWVPSARLEGAAWSAGDNQHTAVLEPLHWILAQLAWAVSVGCMRIQSWVQMDPCTLPRGWKFRKGARHKLLKQVKRFQCNVVIQGWAACMQWNPRGIQE